MGYRLAISIDILWICVRFPIDFTDFLLNFLVKREKLKNRQRFPLANFDFNGISFGDFRGYPVVVPEDGCTLKLCGLAISQGNRTISVLLGISLSPHSNMTSIWDKTFFDQIIPSDTCMPNLNDLCLNFPIHEQFWLIVSNLNWLNSLTVSSYNDTCQSQLQTILDQATHLARLTIHQDASLSLQMSLFKCITPSVRRLDLQTNNYQFNEEECTILTRSPLGIQCRVLHIQVKNHESVVILVKNIINLRALHVQCEDKKQCRHIPSITNDDESHDRNKSNKDDLVEWLTS